MRIAIAQINSTLGDFKSNSQKIIEYALQAVQKRCDVVLFPESALFGYYQGDLLERDSIVEEQLKLIQWIEKKAPKDIVLIFGAITKNNNKKGKPYFNSAVVVQSGKKTKILNKELLPTYDVFDEARHIEQGHTEKNILKIKGQKVLVTICEDIWAWKLDRTGNTNYHTNPLKKINSATVDLVLNLSASPYTKYKEKDRLDVISKTAKYFKAPLIYTNMVGAQDELIFDGGSIAVDKKGTVLAKCVQFGEDLNVVDLENLVGGERNQSLDEIESIRQALVLGLRDFVRKTGLKSVHLGLSGGIDSALVACLAVDALGPNAVTGIALPSEFNSGESLELAKKLAENLNIKFYEMPIKNIYNTSLETIESAFGEAEFSLMNENLQARIRGNLLMAFSNKNGSMLLNTSNKSELATGYSTLYGDLCGGLSPIGDLLKTQVVDLCRLYNSEYELIPERIITRPPSAELRPNQKDSDSLPEYKVLDRAVETLVEHCGKPRGATQKWVLTAMMRNEFKRWQAPPILKVTDHSFGRGRRLPIAHKANY